MESVISNVFCRKTMSPQVAEGYCNDFPTLSAFNCISWLLLVTMLYQKLIQGEQKIATNTLNILLHFKDVAVDFTNIKTRIW